MSNLIWKPVAAGLLLALVVVGGVTGWNWYLAARDLDTARVELATERQASEQLRTSIREQNRAVDALAAAKAAADLRGIQAQQIAAANGKRFDLALRQAQGAKATTCIEAMPAVNQILEAIR